MWSAIVSANPNRAMFAFFPGSVYVRMKTGILANPAGDYADRLVAFYRLDIAAYHDHLGAGPSSASLLAVHAVAADAAWIPAGTCENNFGYWHLPNVRLVYRVGDSVASFAVASLISWRGEWYVVHLGPNPRPYNVGTVALPANGPGLPGPGGGC